MNRPRRRYESWLYYVAAILFFATAWTLAATLSRGRMLPQLPEIGRGFTWLIGEGLLALDVLYSLSRFLAGWIVGGVLGIGFGLVTGRWRRLMGPILEINFNAYRAVPVIALVPLVGYLVNPFSEAAKVTMVAWGVFFPVWVSTHNGARSLNPNYIHAAESLGIKHDALWWRVYVPHLSESILSGLRVSIGVGLICIVAAEATGSFKPFGLGYRLDRMSQFDFLERIAACIFAFGILGWLSDKVFTTITRPLILKLAKFDPMRSTLRVGRAAEG